MVLVDEQNGLVHRDQTGGVIVHCSLKEMATGLQRAQAYAIAEDLEAIYVKTV